MNQNYDVSELLADIQWTAPAPDYEECVNYLARDIISDNRNSLYPSLVAQAQYDSKLDDRQTILAADSLEIAVNRRVERLMTPELAEWIRQESRLGTSRYTEEEIMARDIQRSIGSCVTELISEVNVWEENIVNNVSEPTPELRVYINGVHPDREALRRLLLSERLDALYGDSISSAMEQAAEAGSAEEARLMMQWLGQSHNLSPRYGALLGSAALSADGKMSPEGLSFVIKQAEIGNKLSFPPGSPRNTDALREAAYKVELGKSARRAANYTAGIDEFKVLVQMESGAAEKEFNELCGATASNMSSRYFTAAVRNIEAQYEADEDYEWSDVESNFVAERRQLDGLKREDVETYLKVSHPDLRHVYDLAKAVNFQIVEVQEVTATAQPEMAIG